MKLFKLSKNKIACKSDTSNPDLMDGYNVDLIGQIAFNQENKNDEDDVISSSSIGFVDQGDVDSIPCSSLHQDEEEQNSTVIGNA
jgi:hypothetical protein